MCWARWFTAVTCLVLVLVGAGCSPTRNTSIEPDADNALRQMSDLLAGAEGFRLRSTATIEERLESGQVAQFGRDAKILVRRPDRMYVDVRRGPESYKVWYQGEELTLLDVRHNLYTTIKTPNRIDKMLDFMAEEHGVVFPLADLLFPNPYAVMTELVTSGVYVDEQSVGEHRCHHLLFTQDNVDWQIWIDAEKAPVPRKIVITYKDDPDAPQYEGVLDEWQRATPDEKEFTPELPKEARRVEIDELLGAE